MKANKLLFCVLFAAMVTGLVACGRQTSTESPLTAPESPLPVPTGASPLSPPTRATRNFPQLVPFRLDKPLREGDTFVTGTGPAGVLVRLEDVTFMGEFAGASRIRDDGTFEILLAKPLEARHRMGLTIDFAGTPWTMEDFQSQALYGDEALLVPEVGFYYDTALVQ